MTGPKSLPPRQRFRRALAVFWVQCFFFLAERAPRLALSAKNLFCRGAFRFSPSIRHGTRANARQILGPQATLDDRDRLARSILASFYLFCCDVGAGMRATLPQLTQRIEEIHGRDAYLKARASHTGVIIVTAHMGSFEVGMAALRLIEPNIHVLFRRDAVGQFERARRELRHRLGVIEAALDDGWTIWLRLRNALQDDQAVVLQADRVLPGQKGQRVPFLHGHIELPLGPIKLAALTGSPIVPVFTIRASTGKIRLFVEEPIWLIDEPEPDPGQIDPALLKLARVLEKYISAYPEQWLVLQAAFSQDQVGGI